MREGRSSHSLGERIAIVTLRGSLPLKRGQDGDGNLSRNLRLAIVGLGLVGIRHADAIDLVESVDLVAVVEPSSAGKRVAEARGVPCVDDLDQLFATFAPDGVILATPTPLHMEQAMACLSRSCPVLVEKPIATRARDAEEFVAHAVRQGVPVLVGHHRRHNPLIRRAKEVIEEGRIGEVRGVQATCWFYKPDEYYEAAQWRKKLGAGPISVNLVHDVDLIRHLCGEVETVQAVASPSRRGFENEDVASAVLGFANGAVGTITVSDSIVSPWSWELTSREYPIYPPTSESCYMVGGSEGAISLPDLRVWTHENGQRDWWTPIAATTLTRGASDPLVNQIKHFCEVILGRCEPLVSGEEGLRTLQVIEAIQRAAATGEKVHVCQPVDSTVAANLGAAE